MSETSARLLRLLSLLQTPREWPGSELAHRLDVSARTVRRDVDRLRELGYPVEATMGAQGGYRLTAGQAMPPLLLDDDEAVAMAVGMRASAGQAVTGVEDASVRALAKLEQVLPSRLRYRVRALKTATVSMPLLQPTVDPEQLTVLAGAIANTERLRFAYQAREGGESRRHVEPHRLVSAGRRWYLLAYDLDRSDWRIFRVDRIDEPKPTGARAQLRTLPAEDVVAYVTSKMYTLAQAYPAIVTVRLPAKQAIGRFGDYPVRVEAIDEERCLVHLEPEALEWVATRLIQLNAEFEVHQPSELIAYLRELGARLTRASTGQDAIASVHRPT